MGVEDGDAEDTWGSAPVREWGPRSGGKTPVPARTFYRMVAKYEHEIEHLREDLAEARAEIQEVKQDLRRVLAILDARAKTDARFWHDASSICSAFANDAKVRLVLAAGLVLLGLVLAGVTGLQWRDGGLTIDAHENMMRVDEGPAPLP